MNDQLDLFAQAPRAGLMPEISRVEKKPAPNPIQTAPLEAEARALLKSIGADSLAALVTVRWNPRLRSTAGLANYRKQLILLNPQLSRFGEEEVRRTMLHELAHLLAHYRAGKTRISAHGTEWKKACADLGIAGEKRCHNLPLRTTQRATRFRYTCPGCHIIVPRHRKMKRASACLACCRKHNRGKYDARFKFLMISAEPDRP